MVAKKGEVLLSNEAFAKCRLSMARKYSKTPAKPDSERNNKRRQFCVGAKGFSPKRRATVPVINRVTKLRRKTLAGRGVSPANLTIAPMKAKLNPETNIQAMARGMLSGLREWFKLGFPLASFGSILCIRIKQK